MTMTTAALKRYEDALDALVCGWVGIEYLGGRCTAFGDTAAAIWTPSLP
jgi:predicted RNase H-like nuclease